MAMNTPKVLVGGIAAGIVLNVIDWITYTKVLVDRVTAEAEAFKPGMSASMMSGYAITVYVITDLILGLLLVWTYAAIRPRFGPGPRTAMNVALLFWIVIAFNNAPMIMTRMLSTGLWWTEMLVTLVNLLIAAVVGAKLYSEDDTAAG